MPTSLYIYIFVVLLIGVNVFRDYFHDHNFLEVKQEREIGVYGMLQLIFLTLMTLIYGGFVWW